VIELEGRGLASAHEDSVVRLFDPLSGKLTKTIRAHRQGVACLAAQGHYLFTGGHDGDLKVWDLRNASQACEIKGTHARKYEEGVLALAYGSGGLASAGADGLVKTYAFDCQF
jgi:WD40 repeat protein